MTVPKLRFPEFWEAGEWDEMRLGDITYKTDRKNKGGNNYPIYSINNTVGFVPQAEQFEGVDSKKRGYDITIYKVIERETFAYNPARINVGSIGYSGDLNNIIISSLYVCFKTNKNVYDKFLLHFFGTFTFDKSVNSNVEGGIRSYLFYENFSRIKILLPNKKEQQKIADCLSSIDELITAQAQKLDTLKIHKKGLMQQLFPAEGETVPKLRFPEFLDEREWISSFLGEISTITSGGTPSRSKNYFWNGDIPWITTSLIDFNIIDSANEYISEVGLKESSAKIFPKNTILMAMYGQGKTRGKVGVLGIDAATNQACAAILLKNKFNTYFVFQNLAGRYEEIRDLSNRGGQENLSAGLIEKISFPYPDDTREQQKIADCLSSLDELITAQTQKLDTLKTHKKGLMQQLFLQTPTESTP